MIYVDNIYEGERKKKKRVYKVSFTTVITNLIYGGFFGEIYLHLKNLTTNICRSIILFFSKRQLYWWRCCCYSSRWTTAVCEISWTTYGLLVFSPPFQNGQTIWHYKQPKLWHVWKNIERFIHRSTSRGVADYWALSSTPAVLNNSNNFPVDCIFTI